ncbi:5-dehydro-4-deoxy-D-glucuronate isomerase [Enterococcus faecium]|uniref:5-dehydro-4-deoxy-D-glucuronate isomerase n=1 Tax=Enterococcus faecium TaxID=1352 RepID=UPI000B5B0E39|nr:5-dehydro-4-deoxy-D-glucuronate isomerase [Enterococcus faecium]OWZ87357.1 4-deoxy-L-threo-5-hexosulose-uronate ketol-isomerase 1 [Enterococcus faecium]RXW38405.1 5-dehydro-4-deoxy-D-glucuronate isomerase [Enterococcus faecium]TKO00387.1 5-dehydro-4-deoxy-D-glucuronate isomerase [Enterococcus faecium]TKO30901.1 5-dehydro-4-deoxy-D-glucuronate isomerase [Enterococcus faecium]TKQ68532.1 5-dehydro-4-deoxy-D-glucuronate isomerase [Enterococcus faecium]
MQEMETRYTHSPEDIRHYSTEQLRKEFLVEKVFEPGKISLTYTHNDRMIFGGVTPTEKELEITLDKELGVDYFLERRELGVINIGGPGFIEIDGQKEEMKKQDGYYIGKETRHVVFSSQDAENPAKFYISSVPAHHKYPNVKISIDQVKPMETGEGLTLNERKIYQYIHPNVCESCQLQMSYTILEPGSAWNTMPCHTHERRMEAYVYFDYANEDTCVFHMMGKPDETKHLVVDNEQAIISPSWSIHSGVGTSNYSFIWAMCGENITYTDMDMVQMDQLK